MSKNIEVYDDWEPADITICIEDEEIYLTFEEARELLNKLVLCAA